VERRDGKRALGRPMHEWEDNIKIIWKKWDWKAWNGLIWLRIGTVGESLRCGNDIPGSLKRGEILDLLKTF
jgi:hypothetical protein